MNTPHVTLRPWRSTDVNAIVRHANNRKVWINLRDVFPHPYTHADAEDWIGLCEGSSGPTLNFAIDADGEAVGGIGFRRDDDVAAHCAEVGYWLGEVHWGQGIATQALALIITYGFGELGLLRLYATPFDWNLASVRVLEKAGFQLEGRLRNGARKDGRLVDTLLYARIVA
jgi:ribosomal-protein-alanine N-acetyltransferase